MDAVFAAITIPQFIIAIITTAVSKSLVPVLAAMPKAERTVVARRIWMVFLVVATAIGAALFLGAETLVAALFGIESETVSLASRSLALLAPSIIFAASASVFSSTHHASDSFDIPAVSAATGSLGMVLVVLLLTPQVGPIALAIALLAKYAIEAVLQAKLLLRLPQQRVQLPENILRDIWVQIRPLLLGNLYHKSNIVVDKVLASYGSPGTLTTFLVIERLYSAAGQAINAGVAVPALSRMSRFAAREEFQQFRDVLRHALTRTVAVATTTWLCSVGVLLAAGARVLPLLGISQVSMSQALAIALVGVAIFNPAGQVVNAGFYALQDTSTPTRIGVVTYTLGTIAKIAAFVMFGIVGLATTASLYICATLAWLGFRLWTDLSIREGRLA